MRLEGGRGERVGEGEIIDGDGAVPIGAGEGDLEDVIIRGDPEAGAPAICVEGFCELLHQLHVEDAAGDCADGLRTAIGDLEEDGQEDESFLRDREDEGRERFWLLVFFQSETQRIYPSLIAVP